jgi:hypothetical protein
MNFPQPKIRGWWRSAAALILLDWTLPFGFLHELVQRRRWFPTNVTRWGAAWLSSPGDPAAVMVVSASAPAFWTLGGLLVFSAPLALRLWRSDFRWKALAMVFLQAFFFLAASLVLPWLGERGVLSGSWAEALFPVVPRGHGRAFGWVYLLCLLPFVALFRRARRPS